MPVFILRLFLHQLMKTLVKRTFKNYIGFGAFTLGMFLILTQDLDKLAYSLSLFEIFGGLFLIIAPKEI